MKGTHLESLFDVKMMIMKIGKKKITEALNALKSHPSETKEMKSVHATAMQKARDLVASRKR